MSNQEDKIESYLLGQLSGSELQEFEIELKNSPELLRLVDQHRTVIKRLDAYRIRTKVKSEIANNSQKKGNSNLKWVIGVAASFLIITMITWFFILSDNSFKNGEFTHEGSDDINQSFDSLSLKINPIDTSEQLAAIDENQNESTTTEIIGRRKIATLFLVFPMLTHVRDLEKLDSSDIKNSFVIAKQAFDKQNYKEVLKYLDRYKINPDDGELLFIRAISNFKTGAFDKAALDFNLLKSSYQYKAEADFNFMLCKLAQNKIPATLQLINSMIKDKEYQYRSQAIALKTKINLE